MRQSWRMSAVEAAVSTGVACYGGPVLVMPWLEPHVRPELLVLPLLGVVFFIMLVMRRLFEGIRARAEQPMFRDPNAASAFRAAVKLRQVAEGAR